MSKLAFSNIPENEPKEKIIYEPSLTKRVHESLYRWLVRSAECRTISGAKKIIPVIEKEILKALNANTAEDEDG